MGSKGILFDPARIVNTLQMNIELMRANDGKC
jgi:hypothetical protein